MKDPVRPRNEDPGQRSRDREHWHEDDERERTHRKNFRIHLVFDVLLVVAAAWLGIHFYTQRLRGDVKELQTKITRLENSLETKDKQYSVVYKQLESTRKELERAKRR